MTDHSLRSVRRRLRPISALAALAAAAGILAGCSETGTPTDAATVRTASPAPAAPAPRAPGASTPSASTAIMSPGAENPSLPVRTSPAPTFVTPPAPGPAAPGAPVLAFARLSHDFGVITDVESYRTSFAFTNAGEGRLVIQDIKAACGCTVPTLAKREFMPGEGSQIDIVFDPKGKQDKTDKYITVVSNAEPQTVQLALTSFIKPMVGFERMFSMGDLPIGQEHRRVVPMTYRDRDLAFTRISSNNPHLTAHLLTSGMVDSMDGEDTIYRADLELRVGPDAPWGILYATRVTLDAYGRPTLDKEPVAYTYDMYVMGTVVGELVASPGIISLGQVNSGSSSTGGSAGSFDQSTVITRTTGAPFDILSAAVTETNAQGLAVRLDPAGPNAHRVTIHGSVGTFRGSVKGAVTIRTNVPGEEELLIRFAGLVR